MAFCFFADFFDARWSDDGGFVAEGVSDEGEDGGNFFVGEHFEGRHGNDAGVVRAVDFDGTLEPLEGREVLKSSGRDEDEARGLLTIVGGGRGVLDHAGEFGRDFAGRRKIRNSRKIR